MPDDEKTFIGRLGVSEGVAIASTTIAGYIYAFSFETGYISHYGIPAWFIQLSVVNVLIAFGAVVFVVVVLAYVLMAMPPGPWWALLYQLSMLVLPVGFTVFVLAATDWGQWQSIVVAALLGTLPAVYAVRQINKRLLAPIRRHKSVGSWAHRWAEAFYAERQAHSTTPDLLADSIRTLDAAGLRQSWLFLFVIVFIVGPSAARYLGLASAFFKTQHAVAVNASECIAVRRYGDYLICSDFDRKTRRLLPTFHLLRPGDSEATAVRIEHLGRLSSPSVANQSSH